MESIPRSVTFDPEDKIKLFEKESISEAEVIHIHPCPYFLLLAEVISIHPYPCFLFIAEVISILSLLFTPG